MFQSIYCSRYCGRNQRSVLYNIYKKKDKNYVTNRQINLINFLKCFEMFLGRNINLHVNGKISMHQRGFVQQSSKLTNLVNATHIFFQNIDCKKQTDVVYIYFTKASDTLDQEALLIKLK